MCHTVDDDPAKSSPVVHGLSRCCWFDIFSMASTVAEAKEAENLNTVLAFIPLALVLMPQVTLYLQTSSHKPVNSI